VTLTRLPVAPSLRRPAAGLAAILVAIAAAGWLAERAAGPDALRPSLYDDLLRQAARRHLPRHWDWRVLKAMVYQESRFDPRAASASGAVGLCQVLPATARDLGIDPAALQQPEVNVDTGARLLRRCWDLAAGFADGPPGWDRSRVAVAAYHAGPAVVAQARAACGPAGGSWRALSARLPAGVRRHVEAVFDEALPGARRLHPGDR
jgi:soluble lytic murein transglycosylase-like protein